MIIRLDSQINDVVNFINTNDVLSFDVESTGLNVRKDIVIGFCITTGTSGFYVPIWCWSTDNNSLERSSISETSIKQVLLLLKSKKLLMYNASYDARITKNNLDVDLLPSLYCDVLLLKHCMEEEPPFALKEVGAKIYGQDVKKEKEEMQASIKANGGTAKEYYKADTELLGKYGIQDGLLTYKLFEYYKDSLHNQGLAGFYFQDEVLPLYKTVTIPMESRGIRLDMPLLQQTLVDITQDLAKLEKSIQAAIYPNLGLFTTWFLNKDYPLQTFTGKVPAWAKKYKTQREAFLAENSGYMFNLLSKHHLKKLFFDTLKETPLSTTPTGLPQVDEIFLELMSEKYEWAADLIVFNKLIKIKGTYVERFLDEQEEGRFYPSFKQHGTISGRYSGNLQQLPRALP